MKRRRTSECRFAFFMPSILLHTNLHAWCNIASAGMTFGPVLRAKLEPLFVSGLLKLARQAVEDKVDLTKEIPNVDPAKESKSDIVRACFHEVVSPEASRELKREFIRTVLLDILFLAKHDQVDLPLQDLQKEFLHRIHAQASEMLDNLANNGPVNLLPADLKEALCQALSKGLGNFIDTVV
jgi:hypothetical protein